MDLALGIVVAGGWLVLVLWGAGSIARSAWQGGEWFPRQAAALVASAAIGAGLVLMGKNALPFDMFGVGFLLAGIGGILFWAVGRAADSPGGK